jgi:hypothetical protein
MRGFLRVYLDLFGDSNKEDPAFVLDRSGEFYEETENKSVPLAFSFTDSEHASIISSSLFSMFLLCDRMEIPYWNCREAIQ